MIVNIITDDKVDIRIIAGTFREKIEYVQVFIKYAVEGIVKQQQIVYENTFIQNIH